MPDYDDLPDLSDNGWPQNNADVGKDEVRVLVDSLNDRVGTLPRSWGSFDGDIIVVREDGSGPSPAGGSDNTVLNGRNLKLRNVTSYDVTITASQSLNMTDHNGNDIFVNSASAVALTIAPAGDPDDGIQDGFTCRVWHEGAGAVSLIIDSSYANQHPSLHTKISAQGLSIGMRLKGVKLFIDGNTAA